MTTGRGAGVFGWRAAIVCGMLALSGTDSGQSQTRAQTTTAEREEVLFILNAPPASKAVVDLLWIPAPLQQYCVGRTREQCVAIDYCVRTKNRDVAECRNLPVNVAAIPKYPRDIYPRRVLAVSYFRAATAIPGVADLLKYVDGKPRSDFDRLSMKARIGARIKVKRSADDDDFELTEVLRVPVL